MPSVKPEDGGAYQWCEYGGAGGGQAAGGTGKMGIQVAPVLLAPL